MPFLVAAPQKWTACAVFAVAVGLLVVTPTVIGNDALIPGPLWDCWILGKVVLEFIAALAIVGCRTSEVTELLSGLVVPKKLEITAKAMIITTETITFGVHSLT